MLSVFWYSSKVKKTNSFAIVGKSFKPVSDDDLESEYQLVLDKAFVFLLGLAFAFFYFISSIESTIEWYESV